MSRVTTSDELLWAAGFFDGEGSACLATVGEGRYVNLSVSQVEREPLDRFAAAVGGKVHGPYPREGRSPIHQWRAQGARARDIAERLAPHVCGPKREQIRATLEGEIRLGRPERVPRHGTYTEYVYGKCRCDDCRAANAAKSRARRAAART